MNTKNTMILYSVLGCLAFLIAYITRKAAITAVNSGVQGILTLFFVICVLVGILFFVPVATELVLLAKKK